MADLHWFPFFAKDFLASPAVRRMSDAQVGRYVILLATAWDDGSKEPSLEVADWRKAQAIVKRQFVEREGRYYNVRLSEVWREQQDRHSKRVEKARRAGRASGQLQANSKPTPSQLQANSKPTPSSPEVNHTSMTMDLREVKDSLTRGAGAVPDGGPAPNSESKSAERRNGEGMSRLGSPTDILRMAGVSR